MGATAMVPLVELYLHQPLLVITTLKNCESAGEGLGYEHGGFYGDDPLWDGSTCEVTKCCQLNTPP